MKIELHILQNFAPSCLNRDDTGSPKDCEFGGYRRARISSQCFKRAIRQTFVDREVVPAQDLGIRTRLLVEEIARALTRKRDCERSAALAIVERALAAARLGTKRGNGEDESAPVRTEYLLFVPRRIVERAAELVLQHWDSLDADASVSAAEEVKPEKGRKKKDKKEKAKDLPSDLVKGMKELVDDSSKTPDIALFGRMIADNADFNVDAAVQVAHALSTNRMAMEFDFYTAVDDLQPKEETGAGMMGTVQFTSACMYRFAVLDIGQLRENLIDDLVAPEKAEIDRLTRGATAAFLRGAVEAIPTGKQTSMAAHNLPSFVLAIARERGATWSLANAFLDPIRPDEGGDVMLKSAQALDKHLGHLARMYGIEGIRCAAWSPLDPALGKALLHLDGRDNSPLDPIRKECVHRDDNVASLIDRVVKVACEGA